MHLHIVHNYVKYIKYKKHSVTPNEYMDWGNLSKYFAFWKSEKMIQIMQRLFAWIFNMTVK